MNKKTLWIIFGVFIFLFNISFLQASSIPSDWWGTAMINGEYADGAEVEAYINNVKVASAIVGAIQPNYYLIHVLGKYGDLIQFKINGRNTENELQEWILGSYRLDLMVSIEEPTFVKASKSHWQISIDKRFCNPNWECTGWGGCVDNVVMTRTCKDTNHCFYSYNKPIEKTGCEIISKVLIEEKTSKSGFFIFNIFLTFLILIVLVVSIFTRKR